MVSVGWESEAAVPRFCSQLEVGLGGRVRQGNKELSVGGGGESAAAR